MKRLGTATVLFLMATTVVVTQAGAARAALPPLSGVSSSATERVTDAISRAVTASGTAIGSVRIAGVPRPGDPCVSAGAAVSSRAELLQSLQRRDGCVSFATTSLPDGGGKTTPGLLYLPFALDTTTFAVSADSSVPRRLSKQELQSIYTCAVPAVRPLLPRRGSELRARWLAYLGVTEAALAQGSYPCVSDQANGAVVAENDARGLASNEVVPFSVASYLAQQGVTVADVSSDANLGTVIDPAAGSRAPIVPNVAAYPGDVTFAIDNSSDLPVHIQPIDLQAIYTCRVPGIVPLLPASGGVRAAWLTRLNIPETAVQQNAYPCIQTIASGVNVRQNDGRVLTAKSIVPFSLAAYGDQRSGLAPDVRGSSTLGVISDGAQAPALPLLLNPAYAPELVHRVYSVIPAAAAATSPVRETFLGGTSLICRQSALIKSFGYAALDPAGASPCGSIAVNTSAVLTPVVPPLPNPSATPTASPAVPAPSQGAPTTPPVPSAPSAPTAPPVPPSSPPPPMSGFPNASNTGIPPGTSLTDLGGMLDVADEGVYVDGVLHAYPSSGVLGVGPNGVVDIAPGRVTVTGAKMTRLRNRSSHVVLTGSRIAVLAPAGTDGPAYTVDGTQSSGSARIVLSECKLFGATTNVTIAWKNFSIDRCDVSGGLDAVRLGSNTSVTNSYIHDLLRLPGSHNDIFQIIGGSNVTVRHNTLLSVTYAGGSWDPMNAVLMIGNMTGSVSNMVFDDNYVDGGNFAFNVNWLNVDAGLHTVTNVSITNNVFGRNHRYGPKAGISHGIVWSGNVWADTGGPV